MPFYTACSAIGVLRGSVVKCLTRNQGVLGSKDTSFLFLFLFMGVLRETLQRPSLELLKPKEEIDDMSCHGDITEIMLVAV